MPLLYGSPTIRPPRWEYVILSLIVLLLIGLGIAGAISANKAKEPLRVSDRFLYALINKDYEAAFELTAEPFRQTTNNETFPVVSERISEKYQTSPKISSHRIIRSGDGALVAIVEYDIPGTSGNRLIIRLVQEENIWRVLNINNSP